MGVSLARVFICFFGLISLGLFHFKRKVFFAAGLCAQTSSCRAAGGPRWPGHAHPVPLLAAGPALPRGLSQPGACGPAGRPAALGSPRGFLPSRSPGSSARRAEASSTSRSSRARLQLGPFPFPFPFPTGQDCTSGPPLLLVSLAWVTAAESWETWTLGS